jgi:hypothetical protein
MKTFFIKGKSKGFPSKKLADSTVLATEHQSVQRTVATEQSHQE